MTATRPRATIAALMVATAFVAVPLAFLAHVRRWEARRVELYRQLDATKAAFEEARAVVAAAGRPGADVQVLGGEGSRTADWSARLVVREPGDGEEPPLIDVAVSGANGRLASSLEPLRVEAVETELLDAWLPRLLRAYRERGWAFEVVRTPAAGRDRPLRRSGGRP